MRFNKRTTWLIAFITALTIAFSCLSASAVTGTDVDSMKSQLSELERKSQELKGNIAELQADESKQEQLKAQLERQVANTEEQVSIYSNEIAQLNNTIGKYTDEINEKEKELAEVKEVFKQRLRAMHMSGSSNELLVLLGSDDVADYLAKTELTRSVSAHDKALMQSIVEVMEEIVSVQQELTEAKESKSSAQQELTEKQNELEAQTNEVAAVIAGLNQQKAELTAEQKEVEAAQLKFESEIESALAEIARKEAEEEERRNQASSSSSSSGSSSSGSSSSGSGSSSGSSGSNSSLGFIWPVGNFHYISSPFGYRIHPITGVSRLHSGIDIAGSGINGTPVYAADDGTVSLATYNAGGYGYYVMLYHGNKSDGKQYATLYAHMQKYVVSPGQSVRRGDIIGYVGSTGASTGPHLHFEVRVNGTAVNPLLYY